MHSRIFQLSTTKLFEEEYIEENDFDSEHWFTASIADYVTSSNRLDDISWFLNCLPKDSYEYNDKDQSIVFKEGFNKAYFAKDYAKFTEIKEKITEEIFNGTSEGFDAGYLMYEIKQLIDDKITFYINFFDTDALVTVDEFIRFKLVVGTKYYFGGTLDYHC